jgi:hypothetical protein
MKNNELAFILNWHISAVTGVLSPAVKRPGREVDHLPPPPSAEVRMISAVLQFSFYTSMA